jgi:hypothetical protein
LQFGQYQEIFELQIEQGNIPAALDTKPTLPPLLQAYQEAFWLLSLSRGITGGGMTPTHIEAIRITDAFAVARESGFEPLHFLRVIQPADCLYREHVSTRIENGHR